MITGFVARSFDRGAVAFVIALAAIAIIVPVLNLAVPASSPLHLPTYLVALFGKYICYAVLALSIDLIWGYCGILSLGHGAFFALGGYAMGMYLMRQIGTRGVYANPILPDFMVFLNWPELPVYWYGFQHFAYAALMVMLVPGVLAFVFGWFAFRSRVTGVYLSIITQALTFALKLGFFRNNFGFGGNNGLTDFKDILGFNVQAEATRNALFVISVAALMLGFLVCRAIVASKFGKVLIAIRDAEARTRFLGYRVESYKLFVFTLSACMAGIAGALYVPQVGIINPSEFEPGNSIEAVIWVAVGGRGTLTGAVVGAILVNYAKTYFTSGTMVTYWVFGIATLVVFTGVLFYRRSILPGAVIGLAAAVAGWLLAGSHTAAMLDAPGIVQLGSNWPFLVAGVFGIAALATSWRPLPLGAIFGALLFAFFITPFESIALAPYWLFALGGLFVVVTLLLPRGIVGTLRYWMSERRPRTTSLAAASAAAEDGAAPEPRAAE
jgi:urea transport system permease protein